MKKQKVTPSSTSYSYAAPVSVPAAIASHAEIADRAYEIWLNAGQPANRDLEHWLQAEAELNGASRRPALGASNGELRDPVNRLSADPLDPASSRAAEMQEAIENMGAEGTRRSATSI